MGIMGFLYSLHQAWLLPTGKVGPRNSQDWAGSPTRYRHFLQQTWLDGWMSLMFDQLGDFLTNWMYPSVEDYSPTESIPKSGRKAG